MHSSLADVPSFRPAFAHSVDPTGARHARVPGWAASIGALAHDEDGETLPAPLSNEPRAKVIQFDPSDLLGSALTFAAHEQWDEASWLLHRHAQRLLRAYPEPRRLDDLFDLAGRTLRLLRCLLERVGADVALARRLVVLTRELCFEVVGGLSSVTDLGHRMAMLHAVAHLLDTLGDHQDAQAMREQALVGLRSLCQPRRARTTRISAVAAPTAPPIVPASTPARLPELR
ncbi:MAG: hypothetical protein RIQ60_1737 [Pseudomonadota bacterium]|jgi:hypothetical protein